MREESSSLDIVVQILGPSHIRECARVMALAFLNSPVYLYLFQDIANAEERIQALQWLFERNIAAVLEHTPNALRGILSSQEDSSDNVICCFMWVPSPLPPVTLWSLIKAGFWQLPFRFGWQTTERLVRILKTIDEDHQDQHHASQTESNVDTSSATAEFVSLERMVVLPEYQGKGYGSKALRELIESIDNQDTKPPVRLSTQEERNVHFYQRLGFEVIDQREFHPAESTEELSKRYGFTHWVMIRK